MNKRLWIWLFIFIALGSSATTYFVTRHYTFKSAYSVGRKVAWQQGYNQGHGDGLAEVGPRISDDETKLASVTNQYNTLSDNYNTLRDAVIKYVGATSYQPSTRISCTSNTLSTTTFTNCY